MFLMLLAQTSCVACLNSNAHYNPLEFLFLQQQQQKRINLSECSFGKPLTSPCCQYVIVSWNKEIILVPGKLHSQIQWTWEMVMKCIKGAILLYANSWNIHWVNFFKMVLSVFEDLDFKWTFISSKSTSLAKLYFLNNIL